MYVEKDSERSSVIDTVWLRSQERDALIQYVTYPSLLNIKFTISITWIGALSL